MPIAASLVALLVRSHLSPAPGARMNPLVSLTLALAATMPAIDLDRVQSVARQEGLPLATIRLSGSQRLQLASAEAMPRQAFLKRAGLLAYVVFKRLPSRVTEIEFSNRHAGGEQNCRIARKDFELYLKDGITKVEYERRLAYHERSALPSLPAPPPLPALPTLQLPVISAPAPAHLPVASAPAAPKLATLLALSYGLALGGGRFDAYQLEYGHPLLDTLDVRPSVQMISAFSPLNYMAGSGRSVDGLSFGCDLLGTTRQHPGVAGLSFEGGLGARLASLQGPNAGTWPAMHLRAGLRWGPVSAGVRYPLLRRDQDPTGTWEAMLGLSAPFSAFGGK
jgi:hypothetical protein